MRLPGFPHLLSTEEHVNGGAKSVLTDPGMAGKSSGKLTQLAMENRHFLSENHRKMVIYMENHHVEWVNQLFRLGHFH